MGQHRGYEIDELAMVELSALLKHTTNSADFRRVQCVYMRGKGLDINDISDLVHYSVKHIKLLWTLYFTEGAAALITKPRGGRRRENMSFAEEEALISKHIEDGQAGRILKIAPLHHSLCEKLGKKIAPSSAYRLAYRHGWRKIEPRPHHPRRNPNEAEYFKLFFPETP